MRRYVLMFKLLKEQKIRYVTGLFLSSIANPMSNIVVAMLFMEVFDKAVYDASVILPIILKFLLLTFALAVITPTGIYLVNYAALKTTARLREQSLRKIIDLNQTTLTESHSGDIVSRTTNDIQITEVAYKEQMVGLGEILLNGIGCTIFMFILDWRFASGLIVYQLFTLFIITRFAKPLKKISDEVQSSLGKVTEGITDILAGAHVIRLFNIGDLMANRFKEINQTTKEKALKRVKVNAVYQGVNSFVFMSSFLGFIVVSMWFMVNGLIELGTIIALVQVQNGVGQLFNHLGTFVNRLQSSLAGFERITELLDKQEEPTYYPLKENNCSDNAVLGFYNINFHYEDERKVINNLNLVINKGETVAIVGPSGGGKSTLFKLILGFNFPQNGCISVMGKPASNYTIENLRNLSAFVPQDPYLFSGTIYENISYGKNDATKEEIIEAAKKANAHEFIENLEKGYNTIVGERGAFLSGGQKQRIAIARAIIKNAELLLLDEATSALDNESEALVQKALDELMQEKTSIVIAHRLSTIEKADRILVMDKGTIVEEGTHAQLLSQDGLYAKLYNLQFEENKTA